MALTLDNTNDRALVLNISLSALVPIDLTTGNRTIVSDDNIVTGKALPFPVAIALDSTKKCALVVDNDLDALVAIDLDTGNRTR